MKTTVNYLKEIRSRCTCSYCLYPLQYLPMVKPLKFTVSGSTNTAAGDFVVTGTDDVYHFQGDVVQSIQCIL